MTEQLKVGKSVEGIVREERRRKKKLSPNFRPGVLDALGGVLARVGGEAMTGVADTEAGFERSVPAKMSIEGAINSCRANGIGTQEIVNALVEPAVMRAKAHGDLSRDAIEG